MWTGIVTKFTIKTVPVGQAWGALRVYAPWDRFKVFEALADFIETNHEDPKAAILLLSGSSTIQIVMVYDGPIPPKGAFGKFETLTPIVDMSKTMAYADIIGLADPIFELVSMRTSIRVSEI
jgi:hypothetical protein